MCVCLCECASACDIALLNIRPIFYQNDGGKWILFLLITIVPRHGHFAVFMPNATHISHGIYFSVNMFFFSETSSRYFTYSNMLIDMYFSIPFEISIYDCAQITMNFSSPGKRTLIISFHLELHLLRIEIPTKAIEWKKTNLWFNSREKCFFISYEFECSTLAVKEHMHQQTFPMCENIICQSFTNSILHHFTKWFNKYV